jgi:lysine-specific demethylase 8
MLPLNFAQVDVENLELSKFPKFQNAKSLICQLFEGDAIIIPMKWWHSVRSFGSSNFAVNYWIS